MGHQPLRIRIAAIAVSGALLGLSLGIAAVPPPAAAASASIKLGVLIVQMGAKADPGLKSQLTADLFGVTGSVKAELAAEGVTLTGAVLGPVSISAPCDFDSIAGAAYAKAERQKIPVAKYPYTTFVVVAPENGCQADTLGELGGRWNVVAGSSPSVILHEFGHNLGFMHANRLDCTGKHDYRAIPGSESGCVSQEYHDTYSIMGAIVNSGTGVGLDAWRLSSLGSKVIGSPARIPAANHTIQL
ncbi:MAG: hypothetical protein WCH74_13400, partial [Chloroflexota bacterium]